MNFFPGLRVGHATDAVLKSGVTVFLPDAPAVAAVHVAGGAPATRETDLLAPGNLVEKVDAIVLSGGSAFGLSAADGVMAWLAARGRGFAVGEMRVPIVPGASLFDLANGGDKSGLAGSPSPYVALGTAACEAASDAVAIGSVGAGAGATVAGLKGGFGMAQSVLADGSRIAAYAAVNAFGSATIGSSPHFRAAIFEAGGEFGGLGLPTPLPADAASVSTKRSSGPRANTTLAVIVTDCAMSRPEAGRLAVAAHDGIALAIFPAHTLYDGDTVFALATARRPHSGGPEQLVGLCAAAASTLARAIARGVHAAAPAPGDLLPTWRERHGGTAPGHAR